MTVRDEFLFIAGETALDFLNTEIERDGEPADLLTDAAALERWFQDAELGRVRVTPSVLKGAKRLRAAFREIVGDLERRPLAGRSTAGSAVPASGRRTGRPAAGAPLRVLGEELERGHGALTLHAKDGGFAVEFRPRQEDPRFLLARTAANFLANADPTRIRRCGGTNCILFFYDATKSATRRWCSMAGCGNRMKAAMHYQRTRQSS